jgi:hypothetical protein
MAEFDNKFQLSIINDQYLNRLKLYLSTHSSLLLLFFVSVSSILPIVLMTKGRLDPFWYLYQIPQILTESPTGYISDVVAPGTNIFIIIVSKICCLSPEDVIFLPVSGLIIPICGYILFRKLFNFSFLPLLFIPYFSFLISSSHSYAFSPYGLGTILFLVSIFAYMGKFNKMNTVILLLLCFVSLQIVYYTSQTFFLLFFFYSTFFYLITLKYNFDQNNHILKNLFVAFIILYFTFNKMLYATFLPKLFYENNFANVLSQVSSSFFSTSHIVEPYVLPVSGSKLSTTLLFVWFFAIVAPILFDVLFNFKTITKNNISSLFKNRDLVNLKFSIGLLIISEIIIYAVRGVFSYRMLLTLGPFLTIFSMRNIFKSNKDSISALFLAFLILIAGLYAGLNFSNEKLNLLKETSESIDFLYSNIDENKVSILSDDLYSLGMYKTYGIKYNVFAQIQCIDSKNYGLITGDTHVSSLNFTKFPYDYVVLNQKYSHKPLYGPEWILYEPLSMHIFQINMNEDINKIYDDEIMMVYKRASEKSGVYN